MSAEVVDREILESVAGIEAEMLDLLAQLVESPTTLGNEEPGQALMEQAFQVLVGLEPVDMPLDAELLRSHPKAAPFDWDVSGKPAKIHIAVSPVYYHTYLYGAIVGLQLAHALDEEVGGIVDRPEAGALLRDRLFAPGESVRWDALVERATGSPLSVAPLARAVNSA